MYHQTQSRTWINDTAQTQYRMLPRVLLSKRNMWFLSSLFHSVDLDFHIHKIHQREIWFPPFFSIEHFAEIYNDETALFNKCNDLKTCIINRGQIKVTDSRLKLLIPKYDGMDIALRKEPQNSRAEVVRAKSLQSYPTLCDPMDGSPPGSSVHGIFQARILGWVAAHSPRGSSWPRDGTRVSYVSCIGRWVLYHDNQIIIHILVSILSYLSWNIKIHSCIILHKCIP